MVSKIYDKIVEVDVSLLKVYEGSHKNDSAVETLKASIEKFGIQNPIIIDKNNEIVAHNAVYKAAVALGYTKVPCVYVDDLTDEEVKQFRIADNKTSEFATWNEKKLRKELSYMNAPTEMQPFFDQNIQGMIEFNGDAFNLARKASPLAAPAAPAHVNNSVANTPPVDKEKAMEEQQKFKDELKNIEKSLAVKPTNYFEYICSNCGKSNYSAPSNQKLRVPTEWEKI